MIRQSMSRVLAVLSAGVLFGFAANALAYAINGAGNVVDSLGREWRDPAEVRNFTWTQIDAVCYHDGESGTRTACSGSATGRPSPSPSLVDLTGWYWAFDDEVLSLFREVVNQNGGSWATGPDYLQFTATWVTPSIAALGNTNQPGFTIINDPSASGWSATPSPSISNYAVTPYILDVVGAAGIDRAITDFAFPKGSASEEIGAWLYRAPNAVAEPGVLILSLSGLVCLVLARRRRMNPRARRHDGWE